MGVATAVAMAVGKAEESIVPSLDTCDPKRPLGRDREREGVGVAGVWMGVGDRDSRTEGWRDIVKLWSFQLCVYTWP